MRRRFALVLAARGKKKNAISQPWRMQVIGKSLTCIKIAVVGRKYGHSVKNYASLTRPILIDLALPARSTDEFSQNSYARYSKRTRTKHQQKKKTRKKKTNRQREGSVHLQRGQFICTPQEKSPRSARVPSSSGHFEKHLELVGHFEADLGRGVWGHPVGRRLRQGCRRGRLAELWTRIVVARGWR